MAPGRLHPTERNRTERYGSSQYNTSVLKSRREEEAGRVWEAPACFGAV